MRRRRWKLWAAGLALVALLAGGLAVTVLWPTPSQAEQAGANIDLGMSWEEAREVVRSAPGASDVALALVVAHKAVEPSRPWHWTFADGSTLTVHHDHTDDRVSSVRTTPATPVHPFDRMRGTLSRLFPALGKGSPTRWSTSSRSAPSNSGR
jgi:hypothetical protein